MIIGLPGVNCISIFGEERFLGDLLGDDFTFLRGEDLAFLLGVDLAFL